MSNSRAAYPQISIYPTGSENWHSSGWEQSALDSGEKLPPTAAPDHWKDKAISWWGTMTELQLRGFIVAASLIAGMSLLGVLGQYWLLQDTFRATTSGTVAEVVAGTPSTDQMTTTVTSTVALSSPNLNTSPNTSFHPNPSDPAQININTASEQELQSLPGVGPATAASIMNFRQTHGPFHSLDELVAVDGIGEGKLAKLRDHATT